MLMWLEIKEPCHALVTSRSDSEPIDIPRQPLVQPRAQQAPSPCAKRLEVSGASPWCCGRQRVPRLFLGVGLRKYRRKCNSTRVLMSWGKFAVWCVENRMRRGYDTLETSKVARIILVDGGMVCFQSVFFVFLPSSQLARFTACHAVRNG